MNIAITNIIDVIKSKQTQSENEWQSGYQKALNDILFECETLSNGDTIEALEDFKMSVNKLSYIVNNVGIKDSFDRTLARNTIDEITISFNKYIQTLF